MRVQDLPKESHEVDADSEEELVEDPVEDLVEDSVEVEVEEDITLTEMNDTFQTDP
jgi:hypothetical protein